MLTSYLPSTKDVEQDVKPASTQSKVRTRASTTAAWWVNMLRSLTMPGEANVNDSGVLQSLQSDANIWLSMVLTTSLTSIPGAHLAATIEISLASCGCGGLVEDVISLHARQWKQSVKYAVSSLATRSDLHKGHACRPSTGAVNFARVCVAISILLIRNTTQMQHYSNSPNGSMHYLIWDGKVKVGYWSCKCWQGEQACWHLPS